MTMILDETVLSLPEAAKALPRIDGRKPHTSTLWRWCRVGIQGVKLEYARVGRRIVTSREAIARFCQRLAEADDVPGGYCARQRRPRTRAKVEQQRAIEAAHETLRQAGI